MCVLSCHMYVFSGCSCADVVSWQPKRLYFTEMVLPIFIQNFSTKRSVSSWDCMCIVVRYLDQHVFVVFLLS